MLDSHGPIVAVAGDPGGASAIAPVISHLRSIGRSVTAAAYRQSRSVWTDRQLTYEELDENTDVDAAAFFLKRNRAGLLLTATSSNGVDLEKKFVLAAKRRGIPSVAVLDFWSNYRIRFCDELGAISCLPDRIAVMDEHARKQMISDGFQSEPLIVTGQPAFDVLASLRHQWSPSDRLAQRASLGVNKDEKLVLFASQPLAELYGEDITSPNYLGYTQRTVLRCLMIALERIAGRRKTPLTLIVRPHPRESLEWLQGHKSKAIRVIATANGDRLKVALAADLVIGMNSVLLVEAVFLKCAVVSIQPNLRLPDVLPTNRWGLSEAVYHEADIEGKTEQLLFDTGTIQSLAARLAGHNVAPNAVERVVALIEGLTAKEKVIS